MADKYDVLILGGGTAGVPAAIAAARGGAKTLVAERFGHLGGTAVYGIPFLGVESCAGQVVNRGILEELVGRMQALGGSFGLAGGAYWNTPERPESLRFSLLPFDPEIYKYVAQEMLLEAGAEVLYYTQLAGANGEGGRLRDVMLLNKSGLRRVEAAVFADCTGDADLSFQAGASFLPKTATQNCTILFHVGGVDLNQLFRDLEAGDTVQGYGNWHNRLVYASKTPGAPPSLVHMAGHFHLPEEDRELTFTAVSLRDGEIFLNATRTVGVNGTDAAQLSDGELRERRNVMRTYWQLRRHVPAFRDAVLLHTAPLGLRETRNILGDYVLTREDVLSGTDFPDGIARGAYPIDIHDPKGGRTRFQFIRDGGSYSVPYRCLLPRGLDNVIAAGRCISATHEANGSTRIMGCVSAQGQAAGTAAAMAARAGCGLRELDPAALRQALREAGAVL